MKFLKTHVIFLILEQVLDRDNMKFYRRNGAFRPAMFTQW